MRFVCNSECRRRTIQILGPGGGAHTDEVLNLVFSHDGNHLLTCSRDGTASLWTVSADGLFPLPPSNGTTPVADSKNSDASSTTRRPIGPISGRKWTLRFPAGFIVVQASFSHDDRLLLIQGCRERDNNGRVSVVEAMRGAELVNLAVDPGDTHATWAANSWCFSLHWLPQHPIDYLHVDMYCVQRRLRVVKVDTTTATSEAKDESKKDTTDGDDESGAKAMDDNEDEEVKSAGPTATTTTTTTTTTDGGAADDEDIELMIQYRVRKLRPLTRLLPVNPAGFWPHWLLFADAPANVPHDAPPTKRTFPQWMIWESGLQVPHTHMRASFRVIIVEIFYVMIIEQ